MYMTKNQIINAFRKNILGDSEEWISLITSEYIGDLCESGEMLHVLESIVYKLPNLSNLYEIRKHRENMIYLIRKMGIAPDIYRLIDIYRFSHRSIEDILYICGYNCKVEKMEVSNSDEIQKSLKSIYKKYKLGTIKDIVSDYNRNGFRLPLLHIHLKQKNSIMIIPEEIYTLDNAFAITFELDTDGHDNTGLYKQSGYDVVGNLMYFSNKMNNNVSIVNITGNSYTLKFLETFPRLVYLTVSSYVCQELDTFSLNNLIYLRICIDKHVSPYYMEDMSSRFPRLSYIACNGGLVPFDNLGEYIFSGINSLRHVYLSNEKFTYDMKFYWKFIEINRYNKYPCELTVFLRKDKDNTSIYEIAQIYPFINITFMRKQ